MKLLIACVMLLAAGPWAQGRQHIPDSLALLNETIAQAPRYDSEKLATIRSLKASLDYSGPQTMFRGYSRLYEAYKSFNYDSAYTCTEKLVTIARKLGNDSLYNDAKIKQSFVLLSSGMFKEAFDSLSTLPVGELAPGNKAEVYTLLARCYYDLADYDNDKYHAPGYNATGSRYLDSAIRLYAPGSFDYLYYNGLKHIRSGHIDQAIQYFSRLMTGSSLTLHQVALTASTLSDVYIQKGETDTAITLLVQAAICDLKSSTKETTAIFNLSTLLFRQGDLKNASFYIKKAMSDAVFYGARQRKVQLSSILSLIESEKIAQVEAENRRALTYAAGLALLVLCLAALVVIILRQFRRLKEAKAIITQAHQTQQEINARLMEANKIKEEYIGYFFNGNSEVYTKIDHFKKNLEKQARDRKFSEILFLINHFNIKEDKDELLKNFDTIFLKLFPHFIESYNDLFDPADQASPKEGQVLNTDLRIFALIRLGIHDNEKIAQILGYSVHTINTYKTKVKNRSRVHNDEFEARIMEIKSI
jgi:hypothetical protein